MHACLQRAFGTSALYFLSERARPQKNGFRCSAASRAERKPWYYEMSVIFSKEARDERARKLKEETTRGRFHGPHAVYVHASRVRLA